MVQGKKRGDHFSPEYKAKALARVITKGESQRDVAESLKMSPKTLFNWVNAYREKRLGLDGQFLSSRQNAKKKAAAKKSDNPRVTERAHENANHPLAVRAAALRMTISERISNIDAGAQLQLPPSTIANWKRMYREGRMDLDGKHCGNLRRTQAQIQADRELYDLARSQGMTVRELQAATMPPPPAAAPTETPLTLPVVSAPAVAVEPVPPPARPSTVNGHQPPALMALKLTSLEAENAYLRALIAAQEIAIEALS